MPKELDWPVVGTGDDSAWQQCLESCFEHHSEFVNKMRGFGDARLESSVPGRAYNFSRTKIFPVVYWLASGFGKAYRQRE